MDRETAVQIQQRLPHTRGQVLTMLLAHKPEEQIAKELGIKPLTLKKHIALLYQDFRTVLPAKNAGQRTNMWELLSLFAGQAQSPSIKSSKESIEIYIPHPEIEAKCIAAIRQEAKSLLRIEASPKMGKTTLLNKCLRYSKGDFRTVYLNIRETEQSDLESPDRFLQWFCFSIAAGLDIDIPLEASSDNDDRKPEEKYWSQFFGNAKIKAKKFFEKHILTEPLVVGLDDLDIIYEHKDIVVHFLSMVRSWHELAGSEDRWKNLRLILTYTEEFLIDDINLSPFNVGEHVNIPELNREQVKHLFKAFDLDIGEGYIDKIIDTIGGHPYLIGICIDKTKEISIDSARILLEDISYMNNLKILKGKFNQHLEQQKISTSEENIEEQSEYHRKTKRISKQLISQLSQETKKLFSRDSLNRYELSHSSDRPE